MKYSYINDKSVWYKDVKDGSLILGNELKINKKNPKHDLIIEAKRRVNESMLDGESGDNKSSKIVVYNKLIRSDKDGRLFITREVIKDVCLEEKLYINDFISEKLISKYKLIKEKSKNYKRGGNKSKMLLVTSFYKSFLLDNKHNSNIFDLLEDVFESKQHRKLFTYKTWSEYGFPILTNSVIITNSTEEYTHTIKKTTKNGKRESLVFRGDVYSMTDGRCNLDIVVDFIKLSTLVELPIIAFLEPSNINNTFYFFSSVIALRNLEIIGGADTSNYKKNKFPTDKFVPFFQDVHQSFTYWSKNQILQIYNRTHFKKRDS